MLIVSQVTTLLRYSSLVARSGFPEGTSRAGAAARYQMDLTNPDWRDVLQRQTYYPGLTPSYLRQRTERLGILL